MGDINAAYAHAEITKLQAEIKRLRERLSNKNREHADKLQSETHKAHDCGMFHAQAERSRLKVEVKQLRKFIRNDYSKFEEYHPYARDLLHMYPWLQEAAEAEPTAEEGSE